MKKTLVSIVIIMSAVILVSCSDTAGVSEPVIMTAQTETVAEEQYETELPEYGSRVPVYNTKLTANNKEYDCEVFVSRVLAEKDDMVFGDVMIELSRDGTVLDRNKVYAANDHVYYPKHGENNYWSVLPLENDVLAYMVPAVHIAGYDNAVFVTVNDNDRFEWITSVFSEEELDERASDPFGMLTIPELRWFYIAHDRKITGNTIENSAPDLDFTVTFDFENYNLICDSEAAEKAVYLRYEYMHERLWKNFDS